MNYSEQKDNRHQDKDDDYRYKDDGHHQQTFFSGNILWFIICFIIIIFIICFIAWAVYTSSNVSCGNKSGKWGGDGY